MTTPTHHITGRLRTEADEGLHCRVAVRVPGHLFSYNGYQLGFQISELDGSFKLTANSAVMLDRNLELAAYSETRELTFAPSADNPPNYTVTDQGRARFQDRPGQSQQSLGDFIIREADAVGLQATLGTGTAERYSEGNLVTTVTDRDAFTYAAAMIRHARMEILLSQLFFAIPTVFMSDPSRETPNMIFDFAPPGPVDLTQPRALRPDDLRPERLIIDTAQRGVDIRILLHAFTLPLWFKIIASVLLFPFAGTDGIALVKEMLGADLTDADEVKRYFADAPTTNIDVQKLEQPFFGAGVMHAKLVMADRTRMLSIGSPFGQSYVDQHDHAVDSWIRGGATGYPKHDAGLYMTGPAWQGFFETMELLWNHVAGPNERLSGQMRDPHFPPMVPPPPGPSVLDGPEDGTCSVQIVRTLSTGQFDQIPKGEKGILEAYQRGIANAKKYIYLETQYFTNDAIGDALVEAMLREPNLKVILLLNIEPDVPTYPFLQRRLINRIRRQIGQTPNTPQRFGVFTRWTHDATGPRPRILPVYIHAKVGIIDGTWATVGSANLDGLSLDSSMVSDVLHDWFNRDEQRAIEVNAVLNDNQDPPANVVDILRRKLWAEHLGYRDASGTPTIQAGPLRAANEPADGWLKFWSDHAAATVDHLAKTPKVPSTGMASVLPWPTDNSTHKTPRDHLIAVGVYPEIQPGARSFHLAPLKSTAAFDFKSGAWNPSTKARMDF